jgi:hypothetical protein
MTGQSDSDPIKTATQLISFSGGVKAGEYTRQAHVGQTLKAVIPSNIGSPAVDLDQSARQFHPIVAAPLQ